MATQMVLSIVATARRLGLMYPGVESEIRQINDAVQRLQPKLIASHPAPQAQAPPV